jgi:SAM-dependent methyltransferase
MEYSGHRVLEAMRSAPRYLDAVYGMAKLQATASSGPILDFGAGDGAFVERFQREGYNVVCVEPDPTNQNTLRGLGAHVVADVTELAGASYSFIYTINVLEHLPSPEINLAELHRVLRPGGNLFVFVPAYNCLWTSLDDEVGHVQRFTIRSLTSVVEHAGFVVESARYFDSVGFPAALGVGLLQRFGFFRYSPSSVGFYDKYLFPISRIGDMFLSSTVGKNVVLIARKS